MIRDGRPLTRPTRWAAGLDSFEPGKLATFKLFPGSANAGEIVSVTVANMGMVAEYWAAVQAVISIDAVPFPMMPGQVYVMDKYGRWEYGGWSGIINFPHMSTVEGLQGVHTLLLRTVLTDAAVQ